MCLGTCDSYTYSYVERWVCITGYGMCTVHWSMVGYVREGGKGGREEEGMGRRGEMLGREGEGRC